METLLDYNFYISPSDMIEYCFCKRFIYYMKCLLIPQFEEKRYKVQKGRNLHEYKVQSNVDYLRKRLKVIDKRINVELHSQTHRLKGVVDEILFFEDGTASPLDYKYAKYNNFIYNTYKTQMTMYALMIEETFNVKVHKAYIVYFLSNNKLVELKITNRLRDTLLNDLSKYQQIVSGYFPPKTTSNKRCEDCCYRKICIM